MVRGFQLRQSAAPCPAQMWTLVLLVMLFYCFGVIITQAVLDECKFDGACGQEPRPPVSDTVSKRLQTAHLSRVLFSATPG